VGNAKKQLIDQSGLTIYRYHDHPHKADTDMICAGELQALNLPGKYEKGSRFGVNHFTLDVPMTPRELAAHIEKTLHIAHVRVCGVMDEKCTRIAAAFGAPGDLIDELSGDTEIALTGEACEWRLGEYARDAAQLGFKKALLILGHCGSERDGMVYVAQKMQKELPQLTVRYFESGEVYSYAEQE